MCSEGCVELSRATDKWPVAAALSGTVEQQCKSHSLLLMFPASVPHPWAVAYLVSCVTVPPVWPHGPYCPHAVNHANDDTEYARLCTKASVRVYPAAPQGGPAWRPKPGPGCDPQAVRLYNAYCTTCRTATVDSHVPKEKATQQASLHFNCSIHSHTFVCTRSQLQHTTVAD